ncbi:DNA polymerase IV [Streptacidiphilus monticola]
MPVIHVDLDAFYVSVELRRRPDLRESGVPVLVAGTGPRGVVMSASYDARALGVHAGQPTVRARRLCPDAVVLPPDFDAYAAVSANVMAVLHGFVRRVEQVGLDEAYLDLAGVPLRPAALGRLIRLRVAEEQGLACSVGIGPNKLVAKLASVAAKPDGLREVTEDQVRGFLRPQPAAALPGVGGKTAEALARFGLHTVADLADTPRDTLRRILGAAAGDGLHALSRGLDERPVVPQRTERSLGHEHTFPADVDDPETVRRTLLDLSAATAARLRAAGLAGRTVTLKLRFADLRTITRSRTLPEAVDLTPDLHAAAVGLYEALGLRRARIRLLGVRVEGLAPGGRPQQLELGGREHGWSEVERTVDALAARFGSAAPRPASLLRSSLRNGPGGGNHAPPPLVHEARSTPENPR